MADHVLGSLVVGVGASRGAPVAEILCLIEGALRDAGLSPGAVAVLATVDAKADEPGIVRAAERLGVPLVTYSAEELATVEVPNPSDAPLASVATPSVAEAAALVSGGRLLVPKRKSEPLDGRSARVTCAVASAGPVRDASLPDESSRSTGPDFAGPGAGRHDDRRDQEQDQDQEQDRGRDRGRDGGCDCDCDCGRRGCSVDAGTPGTTVTAADPSWNALPHHPRSASHPHPHPHPASASANATASASASAATNAVASEETS